MRGVMMDMSTRLGKNEVAAILLGMGEEGREKM